MDFIKRFIESLQGPRYDAQEKVEDEAKRLREQNQKVNNLVQAKRKVIKAAEKVCSSAVDLQQAEVDYIQAMSNLPGATAAIDDVIKRARASLVVSDVEAQEKAANASKEAKTHKAEVTKDDAND